MRRRREHRWAALIAALWATAGWASDLHLLAQQHFASGREALAAGKLEAALQSFEASEKLFTSPNNHLYIGRCHRELGRLPAAYASFDRAARDAHELAASTRKYSETERAAAAERDQLLPRLGRLRVELHQLPAESLLSVAGESVPTEVSPLELPVMPGAVALALTAPNFTPRHTEVQVTAGGQARVAMTVARQPELRPYRWPALSAGVAALVGVGVSVGLVLYGAQVRRDFDACLLPACSGARYQSLRLQGESVQAASIGGFVLSGLLTALAGALFALPPPHPGALEVTTPAALAEAQLP
ncbi:MAG: hypothetical protein IPJ65_13540 [Archangiaceae bacterium]|nr:hypothetical protein [Archangiaceae bacterium]